MDKRKITFTNAQVRFIVILIVSMAVVLLIESLYLIYLKVEKYKTKVEVVEVPPVVLRVEKSAVEKGKNDTDVENVPEIKVYSFDYKDAILNSFDFLDEASDVYIYTVEKNDVEKVLGSCGEKGKYLLTKVSTGVYSLVSFKPCNIIGRLSQKTLYGIVLLSTTSEGFARAKMIDLRDMGYPSFVYHFKKNEKDYYSTVLGGFPSRDVGRNVLRSLPMDFIAEELGIRDRGYVACIVNCGR